MAMIRNTTRPSSVASFFSGMARCAALYFRKKRSHAPGPTTIIAGPADGAFFEGSKAQRAQHASHDREKCAGCRPCSCREHRGRRPYDRAATLDGRALNCTVGWVLSLAEQDVYRAGTAIHLTCGYEGQHRTPFAQPVIHTVLEYRSAIPGAKPLAVNDTDAQLPLSRAVLDKVSESRFSLGNSHAVQIDLSSNAETASRELAHGATTNGWAMKAHALRIAAFHRVDV